MSDEELVEEAASARGLAYAPFSGFKVGAAISTEDGKIFRGCNVESAAFGASLCAERVALCSAVAHGERSFVKLAIFVGSENLATPCGICRQLLLEFAGDLEIILANNRGKVRKVNIRELLPDPFTEFGRDED